MTTPLQRLEEIESRLESSPPGELQSALREVFRGIEMERERLDDLHGRARRLLSVVAREKKREARDPLRMLLVDGDARAVIKEPRHEISRAIRRFQDGSPDLAADLLEEAGSVGAWLLAAQMRATASLAQSGLRMAEPLPEDPESAQEATAALVRCEQRLVALARTLREDTWEAALARCLLAECLIVTRRFSAALVTLTPLVKEGAYLREPALYLSGRTRFHLEDRAKARSDWAAAAERADLPHGAAAARAVDALSARQTPETPAFLDLLV